MSTPTPPWYKNLSKQQLFVIVAYLANTFFTFLSQSGAYGCTNKEQSDKYYTLLSPPGWAFAIWGLIFIWEFISVVFQALPSQKTENLFINDNYWLLGWGITCVAQSAWSYMFCKSVEAAAALIFLVWVGLVIMNIRAWALLKVAYGKNVISNGSPWGMVALYLGMVAPFSVHGGWLTAATTLNIQIATLAKGTATAQTLLTLAVLCVVFVMMVAWTVGGYNADTMFAMGIAWALFAISHHETRPITTNTGPYTYAPLIEDSLRSAAGGACTLVVGFALVRAGITFKQLFPTKPTEVSGCEAHLLSDDTDCQEQV